MKIVEYVKGFLVVSLGLCALGISTYLTYCAYLGHETTTQRLKDFQGALSRAQGGDYLETREAYVEPVTEQLSPMELAQAMSEEQRQDMIDAIRDVNGIKRSKR